MTDLSPGYRVTEVIGSERAARETITGSIAIRPTLRRTPAGKPCVRATIVTEQGEWLHLVCYGRKAREALLRREHGDEMTLTGTIADGVMTVSRVEGGGE
ncbi:hypothetical protein ACNHKD_12925 [Methylocystis sp. JAN1]|uniref:hypothetical protein n=1 Tax=Methylocystis sp. JAN1 TaxID=3397211 RepID=UPI003FA2A22C